MFLDWEMIGEATERLFERDGYLVRDLDTMKEVCNELKENGISSMGLVLSGSDPTGVYADDDCYLADGFALVLIILEDNLKVYNHAVDILEPAEDADLVTPFSLMDMMKSISGNDE